MRLYRSILALPFLLLLSSGCQQLSSSDRSPAKVDTYLFCPFTPEPITIDGKLADLAWQQAPIRYPIRVGELSPANTTEAKVLWDDENLYVGFHTSDADIRSTFKERDAHLWRDGDVFEFFIYVPGKKVTCIELELNPNDAFLDICHIKGQSLPEKAKWNWPGAQWKTHIAGTLNYTEADRYWSGELKLPWQGLKVFGIDATPTQLKDLRILIYSVNRSQLTPHLTSREQCYWPPQPTESVKNYEDYGHLVLVSPEKNILHLEGYQSLITGRSGNISNPIRPDYRGMSIAWEYRTAERGSELSWNSQAVPEEATGKLTFAFVGSTIQQGGRSNEDRTPFTLYGNDKPLVTFTPYQYKDMIWQQGDVTMNYKYRCGNWQPSGLFLVTFPADLFPKGRKITFSVKPKEVRAETVFMLKAYTDSALFEHFIEGTGPAKTH